MSKPERPDIWKPSKPTDRPDTEQPKPERGGGGGYWGGHGGGTDQEPDGYEQTRGDRR